MFNKQILIMVYRRNWSLSLKSNTRVIHKLILKYK
jgi:hypothetical protein